MLVRFVVVWGGPRCNGGRTEGSLFAADDKIRGIIAHAGYGRTNSNSDGETSEIAVSGGLHLWSPGAAPRVAQRRCSADADAGRRELL